MDDICNVQKVVGQNKAPADCEADRIVTVLLPNVADEANNGASEGP